MRDNSQETQEIKDRLYGDRTSILSTKICYAWTVVQDDQQFDEQQRLMAYHYLIFVFDLHEIDDINEELHRLMNECERHWPSNPEYIPHKAPYYLEYPVQDKQPQPTVASHHSTDNDTNQLLRTHEALDVNSVDKVNDTKPGHIHYLNNKQRAQHRVLISHQDQNNNTTQSALFYDKKRNLFSTKNMIAHNKRGYAAFTLNINGELSVFSHLCTTDGIAHSSMNAGAPVISAGELVIDNGKLLAINTFSGHYEPSLYSQLRVLDHFSRRGVDLKHTKIFTQQNPEQILGRDLGSRRSGSNRACQQYYTPALALLKPYREQIKLQMRDFKNQSNRSLKSTLFHRLRQTKQYFSCNKPMTATYTGQKLNQYTQFKKNVGHFIQRLDQSSAAPPKKIQQQIQVMMDDIARLKAQNNVLRMIHAKEPNSGRLHQQFTKLNTLLDNADQTSAITAREQRKMGLSTTY